MDAFLSIDKTIDDDESLEIVYDIPSWLSRVRVDRFHY